MANSNFEEEKVASYAPTDDEGNISFHLKWTSHTVVSHFAASAASRYSEHAQTAPMCVSFL